MSEMRAQIDSHISFPFHLYDYENKCNRTVEKSDTKGRKHRYMIGISSGIAKDLHGERMTQNCIKSFMDQANSGDVLLYPDIHGIKESEDIGILDSAKVTPENDWYTEYRLYDDNDDIGQFKAEKIDDIWKQTNGLPPYRRPRQKGFSIEGNVPEGGLISAEKDELGNYRNRVMDNVLLDGVILVPRPAYKSGIANAVYKFLGELPPWKADIIKTEISGELQKVLKDGKEANSFYLKRWDVMDALDHSIEKVMKGGYRDTDKNHQLEILFDEYKSIMKSLILSSESVFRDEPAAGVEIQNPYGQSRVSKADTFEFILDQLEKLNMKYRGK